MKTIQLSEQDMLSRLARYRELSPLTIQSDPSIPTEARDVIYARQLMSVIGLENADTPINRSAPIIGAGGITMTLAVCPPGQGPSLHNHAQTYETFTVLKGRFEVAWNDNGSGCVSLETWDTLSVPPGVCRAFRNIGTEEAVLQVIISGGVHDMNDIAFTQASADRIRGIAPDALSRFEAQGFRFNAGVEVPVVGAQPLA